MPTLYTIPTSPPVRAVLMTAKAIGLELEIKTVNMANGEHLQPAYLKMNPQHTVPLLVDDDGFTIWDSHAINVYLVSKYAKDDSLYPKDLKTRALIDQRLHFDSGTIFHPLANIVLPIVFGKKKKITEEDIKTAEERYQLLEIFLEGRQWMAGDSVTLADFSLLASISSVNLVLPVDGLKFPKVKAWLARGKNLSAYEGNKTGLDMLEQVLKSRLRG